MSVASCSPTGGPSIPSNQESGCSPCVWRRVTRLARHPSPWETCGCRRSDGRVSVEPKHAVEASADRFPAPDGFRRPVRCAVAARPSVEERGRLFAAKRGDLFPYAASCRAPLQAPRLFSLAPSPYPRFALGKLAFGLRSRRLQVRILSGMLLSRLT
jgi:hypothetical protein